MGKQPKSRRGHRQRRGKDGGNSNPSGHKKNSSLDDPEKEGAAVPASSPTLLKRLRHGDEATRLAALVALQHRPGGLVSNPRLLEAVRDQLMGGSLVVSTQACHCMLAHLSLGIFDDEITAGWTNLLVQRLQTCVDLVFVRGQQPPSSDPITVAQTPAAASKTKSAISTAALEFAACCLECLAVLTEVNPLAMRRILRSRLDVLSVLAPWLLPRESEAGGGHSNGNSRTAAEWAARCLHSVVDDNADLVVPWLTGNWERDVQPRQTLQALQPTLLLSSSSGSTMAVTTATAQLHAAGAWLSIERILSRHASGGASRLRRSAAESPLLHCLESQWETCLRLLVSHTQGLDRELVPRLPFLREKYAEWTVLQRDAALEQEVVACQEAKQESARTIARRLKKTTQPQQPQPPLPQEQQDREGESNEEAMVVEPEEDSASGNASQPLEGTPNQGNVQQAWEDLQSEWHNAVRPFQLSLEILINLTTLDGTDDDDDDDASVLPDAEPTLDVRLSNALVQLEAPKLVQALLAESARLIHAQPGSEPPVVTDALSDVTNKAGTLLGHLLANLPNSQWQAPSTLWDDLIALLQQASTASLSLSTASLGATRCDEDGAVSPLSIKGESGDDNGTKDRHSMDVGMEGITAALVMGLQAGRIGAPGHALESIVHLVLQCLPQAAVSSFSSSPVAVRNLLSLLGRLLASAPHSAQLNREACAALLRVADPDQSRPPPSIIVAEACNVLMDVYGNDDDDASVSHRHVFDELNAVQFLRRSARALKGDDDEMALNAERFIQYMTR